MKNGYDLISYKDARIDALSRELAKKEKALDKIRTFVFELLDKDCPEDYKRVVRSEVFEGAED